MQLWTGGEIRAVLSELRATSDRRRRNPNRRAEPDPNLILIRGIRDSAVLSYSTSNLHIEKGK